MKVAVIEEPKSCASCPLFDVGYAFDMCRLSKKQVTTAESINIPDWCELRPLPPRKRVNVSIENGVHITGLMELGWNECLDAIVGEEV